MIYQEYTKKKLKQQQSMLSDSNNCTNNKVTYPVAASDCQFEHQHHQSPFLTFEA
jgi:hypothetical protein